MAGWSCYDKEVIEWDGIIKARNGFVGDGSKITNLPAGSEVDPIWTAASGAVWGNIGSASAAIIVNSSNLEATSGAYLSHAADASDPHGATLTQTTADITTLKIGGVAVTSTAAELNLIDGYTGTAANLNTLTNDSMADALHRHSELSASDGTPNPALQVDATGNVGIGTTSPASKLTVAGQVSITGASRMRAGRITNQAIASNSWVIVQFATETFDNLGEYDSATNYRFTATEAGYYSASWSVLATEIAWAVGEVWRAALYKNGAEYSMGYRSEVEAASTVYLSSVGTDLVYLAANDYLDIRVYASHAGTDVVVHGDATYSHFSVHRLS